MEAAAVEVGLSLDEYYSLTPRRWQLIFERYVDREIRHERSIGMLAMLYANAHRDYEKHPKAYRIEDFAPALRDSKPVKDMQSGIDQITALRLHHEVLAAKGRPTGTFGKLSQEELDALYLERHRVYGKVQ